MRSTQRYVGFGMRGLVPKRAGHSPHLCASRQSVMGGPPPLAPLRPYGMPLTPGEPLGQVVVRMLGGVLRHRGDRLIDRAVSVHHGLIEQVVTTGVLMLCPAHRTLH